MGERLTERALPLADFGPGDALGGTRLRERCPLARDVAQVLHLVGRCSGASCRTGLFQSRFGAVEFVRRPRAHLGRAARPLKRRARLIQSRMLGWCGTAGDQGQDQQEGRDGAPRGRALAQAAHGRALGSGTAATPGHPAGLVIDLLAQLARDRLRLRSLRLHFGQLGIDQGLLREGACAIMGLRPERRPSRL